MSNYVPLASTPTDNEDHRLADGTLSVLYRVQDGVVHVTGADSHFTPANDNSTVKICAKSSRFEKLGETLIMSKPNHVMAHWVRALPITAAALTLIVLIVSSLPSRINNSAPALIWAGSNIPFCIYQIVAAFVGGVNYFISFGLTIILVAGAVAEGALSANRDAVGASMIFLIGAIYLAHAIILGRITAISRICCRPSHDEEDDATESKIHHSCQMSNLPLYSPTETLDHRLADGALAVLYRVQGGVVQAPGLGNHFTPADHYSTVKICAESAKFEKLDEIWTIVKPKPAMVHLARSLPISAAVLTIIVIIVSSLPENENPRAVAALFWAVANSPFCIYQIVAGFIGRVNYVISFGITIITAAGAVAGCALSFILREWVSAPMVVVIFAIYIANTVVLGRITRLSRTCRASDDEEDAGSKSNKTPEETHLLGNGV